MYDIQLINELAEKYVKTSDETVFEALIEALVPVIDAQLKKSYQSLEEYWDDMRQEICLKLLETKYKR